MNERQLLRLFPNASKSTIAANAGSAELPEHQGSAGQEAGLPAADSAELERRAATPAVGKAKAKATDPRRHLVRVTSVRRRLIDSDNLCEKYAVDCCRYAGLIPGDGPGETQIEVAQRKAGKEEAEHTVIEIYELTP